MCMNNIAMFVYFDRLLFKSISLPPLLPFLSASSIPFLSTPPSFPTPPFLPTSQFICIPFPSSPSFPPSRPTPFFFPISPLILRFLIFNPSILSYPSIPSHPFLSLIPSLSPHPSIPSYPSFSSSPSFLPIPPFLVRYLPILPLLPLIHFFPTTPSLATPPYFPIPLFLPTPPLLACFLPFTSFCSFLPPILHFHFSPSLPHPLPPSPFHSLLIPFALLSPPSFALLHSLSLSLCPFPSPLSLSLSVTLHNFIFLPQSVPSLSSSFLLFTSTPPYSFLFSLSFLLPYLLLSQIIVLCSIIHNRVIYNST